MNHALLILCSLLGTGCDFSPSATDIERKKQEELTMQGVQQIGLPAVVNFQEKRTLKMILELRDTELKTITYTQDMNGGLHKICDSVGYGIPYATQFTNPMTLERTTNGLTTMPQSDPNGLYSPASADGTWVLCLNVETKKMSPVFIEPRIIVSPFALGGK